MGSLSREVKYKKLFRAELVAGARFVGQYDMPLLTKVKNVTEVAVPFDRSNRVKNRHQYIHFYIDDYRFECLWKNPTQYISLLKSFDGVITPDYSLFSDTPMAMQIWNTYRNRALAYWMQSKGINIIPNIQWNTSESYEFCFAGIPKGSSVAVSTNGCYKSLYDQHLFITGFQRMPEIVEPCAVIAYSSLPQKVKLLTVAADIPIYFIKNYQQTIRERDVDNG